MKQTHPQIVIESVENLVFERDGLKMIALENYALDFKQSYVYLGFTKNGKQVILGDVHTYGLDGVKYTKKFGKIELNESSKIVDGKVVPYKYYQLSTDGFRYSIKLCEVDN